MSIDSPLLQRIVGAAVLVALGVIFIPALLDGSGYRQRQLQKIEVPDKPAFPPLRQKTVAPIASPVKKPATPAKPSAASAAGGEKPARKSLTQKRRDHHKAAIHAYALQVGTFSKRENAERLRDRLRKAGYAAFVAPEVESNGQRFKVRIGPELEKSRLLAIQKKLRKSMKLKGYVVNHP